MLTIAGIGPGNPKYLTVDVKERIEKANHVLAFGRVADSLGSIRQDFIRVNTVDEIMGYIEEVGHKEILILASGDPNFFGIVNFLRNRGVSVGEVFPGLSSFQYLMARLKKPWQDAKFISLHGREGGLEEVVYNRLSIILIDKVNTPSVISHELYRMGIKGTIYVGFNLSYDDETIIEEKIGEEIQDISSLGVVVVENEMEKG